MDEQTRRDIERQLSYKPMLKLEPGDIVLGGGTNSPILKFMRHFQKDTVNYSHCMVVKDFRSIIHSSFKWGGPTGVMTNWMDYVWAHYPQYKVIRMKNITEEQKKHVVDTAMSMKHIDYSFTRIILQLFDHIFQTNWFTKKLKSENDQVCSSFVAYLYKDLGVEFNGVSWESCDPDDIDDHAIANPDTWVEIDAYYLDWVTL